jgi:ComF family protein
MRCVEYIVTTRNDADLKVWLCDGVVLCWTGWHTGPLKALIATYKFQNVKSAAASLAQLLDQTLPPFMPGTRLVPIPTAPSHIRERGYDHALLIAKQLARLRDVRLDRVLARRGMATQHRLNRNGRLKAAKEAFELAGPINSVADYIIVDDVLTTGATMTQAALLLRGAGARSVHCAVVARQPLD